MSSQPLSLNVCNHADMFCCAGLTMRLTIIAVLSNCQGCSRAGKMEGMRDARTSLVRHLWRLFDEGKLSRA